MAALFSKGGPPSLDICIIVCGYLCVQDLIAAEGVSVLWRASAAHHWKHHLASNYLSFRKRTDFVSDKHLLLVALAKSKSLNPVFFLVGGTFNSTSYFPATIRATLTPALRGSGTLTIRVIQSESVYGHGSHVGGCAHAVTGGGRCVLMGGWSDMTGEVVSDVRTFSAREPERLGALEPHMSFPFCFASASSALDGGLFVTGGSDSPFQGSANVSAQALYYSDRLELPPRALANMTSARCGHGSATLFDGSIVAVGGYAGSLKYLSSAEQFHAGADRWLALPSMETPRTGFACVLGACGSVYAAGGSPDGTAALDSLERYDPREKRWYKLASMSEPRAYVSACLGPGGRLFVAGGIRDSALIPCIECFDPCAGRWMNSYSVSATSLASNEVAVVSPASHGALLRASAGMFLVW